MSAAALISMPAHAAIGVEGTRRLAMGQSTRGSATGAAAAFSNPAALSVKPLFEAQSYYQLGVSDRMHGLAALVVDSLNNPRLAVGLMYTFFRASPRVYFSAVDGEARALELSLLGHQAAVPISVVMLRNWLSLGLKPKYQYLSLRYLNDDGIADDAHSKLKSLGLDLSLLFVAGRWMRIGVVVENLSGAHPPAVTEERDLALVGVGLDAEVSVDTHELGRISAYPLSVSHGLAVYPLGRPQLSLNVDGSYDFTSFADEQRVRPILGGSAELVLGPVPVRVGSYWDGYGGGGDDDRVFVSVGVAYVRDARVGGWGVDLGVGVSQQVSGPNLATVVGANLGIRMHPDR